MEIVDYSKLKEVRLVEIELKENKKLRLVSLIVLITLVSSQFYPGPGAIAFGIFISLVIYLSKYIANKISKQQFIFISQLDNNYVEIVYKNKLQAINSKVTCHPECNPVRIVQHESNRLYTLSNISDSMLKSIS